ncbi:hypothetical protein CTI12_AA600190 [Artemisia annua]|uniref:Large ribosomal subunit protein bL25 beta domain-containing protein n=1 Tax=Artemisia annua TaxID=35608 RepID=A0A2U1KI43_ARTAN|nr:hypothetical protein CTI12_AA600190 [Artemisia annua]
MDGKYSLCDKILRRGHTCKSQDCKSKCFERDSHTAVFSKSETHRGGFLNKIRTSLKYKCPSEHIPQKLEVDISNLDIGDRVFMQDVKVHPSLELLSKN